MVYKRAQDVTVGDHMYVSNAASGKGSLQPVTGVSPLMKNLPCQTWSYLKVCSNYFATEMCKSVTGRSRTTGA